MPIKAVTFDAYGTLLRNEALMLIPQRIVCDHALAARAENVLRVWLDRYAEATQRPPFRTLRAIQADVLREVLQHFDVDADASPYVSICSLGSRRRSSSTRKSRTS